MAYNTNWKFLSVFICGIFFAQNAICATITNKSSNFSARLSSNTTSNSNASDSAIAEQIRAQRAAIDARDNKTIATQQTRTGATSNKCDTDLRKCIESRCGTGYTKCATDTDTTFSDKLTACRKNTTCTAHEFSLFVNQIKADKKQEITLSSYNKVINCGNQYNDCIIGECGPRFDKCLSKSAGDRAIAKCKTIADQCREADSALTGRAGRVFGIVRTAAEKQIAVDEKRLRELRNDMRKSCESLGALFDERSLDCVFTVNFFADNKQMASKKLYAGSVFDCTPDWFGIDITTFRENAYRLTRAQTAASSAMLGSGVGTAVGALTSGAIGRAIDTKNAKDALESACTQEGKILGDDGKCRDLTPEEKCENSDGDWKNNQCICDDDKKSNNGVCIDKTADELCRASGGTPNGGECNCTGNKKEQNGVCVDLKRKEQCDKQGGTLTILGKCECSKLQTLQNGKCTNNNAKITEFQDKCIGSDGSWNDDNTCTCPDGKKANKNYTCVNTFGTNIKNAAKKVASIGNSINKSTSGAQRALVSAAAQSEGIPKPVADAAANLGIDARDELFNQGQQLLLGSENM